jgi:3'-5' exoribonuclease
MRLLNESNGSSLKASASSKASRQNQRQGHGVSRLYFRGLRGECAAKLWDYSRELHGVLRRKRRRQGARFHYALEGHEQLKIDKIRRVTPEDAVDMAKLLPCSPFDPEWLYDELFSLAEHFSDDDLRRLVQYLLRENKEKLLFYPARSSCTTRHAGSVAPHLDADETRKSDPRNLPRAGRRPRLLRYDSARHWQAQRTRYRRTGHRQRLYRAGSARRAHLHWHFGRRRRLRTARCAEETAMLVEHMLLAHHGQAEFGSPKLPMFPEAEVLAEIDLLDSKMYEMFDALSGVSVGAFSERQWALDNRQIYCHGHGHLKKGESK